MEKTAEEIFNTYFYHSKDKEAIIKCMEEYSAQFRSQSVEQQKEIERLKEENRLIRQSSTYAKVYRAEQRVAELEAQLKKAIDLSYGFKKFTLYQKVPTVAKTETTIQPGGGHSQEIINYTFQLGDEMQSIEIQNNGTTRLIIPPDSIVPFPIGTVLTVIRPKNQTGDVTFIPGPDVIILPMDSGNYKALNDGYATFSRKINNNLWELYNKLPAQN